MPEIPVIPYDPNKKSKKKSKTTTNRGELAIQAIRNNRVLKAIFGPVRGNPGKRTMTKKDQQNRINKTPTKKKKKTTPEDKYPSNRSY